MQQDEIQHLINRYHEGKCNDAEIAFVESWYNQWNKHLPLGLSELELGADLLAIKENVLPTKKTKTFGLWPRMGVAAAAVIGIAVCVWLYKNEVASSLKAPRNDEWVKNDIAPGKNTATLTSSNGKTINLSEAKTGVAIDATALSYNDGTKIDPSALGMTDGNSRSLEVITPKGGTYSIILQDGTKVWLNADSKLEFLSNYRNKLQRVVKLTGEGYFEVAKVFSPARNRKGPQRMPFIVESKGQQVEVLGTHFNISAYKGEAIRTTLLEGSVRIEGKLMLKPGQQSEISLDKRVTVTQVTAPDAIAWVKGKFQFNNTPLLAVMQQVSRWYDVDIIYPEGIPDERFSGDIDRSLNASEVLRILEKMHVKFKIEGKKIIVHK